MDRNDQRIARLLVCLTALVSVAQAQEIRGIVTDPSGAVVADALVRLSAGDVVVASTKTDRRGNYLISARGQNCSPCSLTVSAEGFAAASREVSVQQGERLAVPFQLEIAGKAETVSVDARSQPLREHLDISDVRESPAKDVGEALTAVDGVYKIRKAGIANDVVVRGFQQNNVNVLIDGARIYGACPGHMDPAVQHADFAEVERVEVVKGPFDIQNSGSLGATINVVTKTPPLGFRITPSFSTGSFGYFNPNVTASLGRNAFRMLAGYSYRTSDPYRDGSGRSFLTYANYKASALARRSFDINTGWFETEVYPSEHQKISLAYTRQQSGPVLYPYEAMDSEYDNADRASFKYEIRDLSGTIRAVRLQTYLTQVVHFMTDTYRDSAMMGSWMMAANAHSRTIGGRIEADAGPELTLGVESYSRNWNMAGYMKTGMAILANPSLPDVGTSAVGAFADYRHPFTDRLRLTGGIRFDHASMATGIAGLNTDAWYKYQDTRRTSTTDNYASGNVLLSYTLPRGMELFAGIGTAGRVPDAEERYLNRVSMMAVNIGNPNLPIVRDTEVAAGVVFQRRASYIKPTVFYSNIGDYILVNNQPLLNMAGTMGSPMSARSYTSVDARIYGGEVSYAIALPSSFSWTGGGSYSKGTNTRKPLAGVLDTNLPEMPPLRAWTALRYTYQTVWAEVGGTAVNRQELVDRDLRETPTAGYGLMNLKVGFTYRKLFASFAVDNLLNRYYYEHLSYYRDPFASGVKVPEPGRNLFLQVKYAF
jgi:iron complex outermembrane receptor protein